MRREPADGADAIQDTFVIAAAKLGGLRSPDRRRPWRYAVARNECRGSCAPGPGRRTWTLTALWRKRVSRHIEECDIRGDRKRELLSPAILLSLVPLMPLPAGLRGHLMRLVSDDSHEAVSYRGRVVSRAGPSDPGGFPVQIVPVRGTGLSRWFRGGGRPGGSRTGGAGGGGPGGRHHPGAAAGVTRR